jgi:dienelactone hydrolase
MKKSFFLLLSFLWLTMSVVLGQETASSTTNNSERLARDFVSLLAQQEFSKAEDKFDDTMKTAVPPDKLKTIWIDLLKTAGAFQKMEAARMEAIKQYQVVFVTCQFQKQRLDVKVVIDKTNRIAGLFFVPCQIAEYRLPDYAKPSLFMDRQVTVGTGQWALPGTLSLPVGKGPFPAVILVHGSGPNDRDESIGANKPFRDLASGLASKGVAVLRYEKRTKQYAAKLAASLEGFTVKEETITDALEAVSLLRKTEGIDPNRVFVLGHSLGGMLVPRIGTGNSDIAGFIIMAGAARPLEDLMLEQTLYQASLAGELSAEDKSKIEEVKRQVAAVKNLSSASPSKGLLLYAPTSYWLDLQGYNPATVAKTLKQPMLILQGEQDCQVNLKDDFEKWQQALSDRKDVMLKSYPALNHLFMEVHGKSTGAEYEQAGHVAEVVVNDIATWIKQH